MSISLAFGMSVKLKRVELGMSQETLAYEAWMARSFLSGIERGKSKPTIDSIWKLAQALKCKPSDLWLETERIYSDKNFLR